jgi:hypothetical protein
MGMFDNVDYSMKCPVCGKILDDFQTKDMSKMMITFKIENLPDKASFHSSCTECGLWVEFVKHKNPTKDEILKMLNMKGSRK